MKKIFIETLLVMLFLACNKNEEENSGLPPGIQQIIDENNCICDPYIKKFNWRNQVVYLLGYTGPACSWMPGYFDKDGEPIIMATGYTLDDFLTEALFLRLVWQCE